MGKAVLILCMLAGFTLARKYRAEWEDLDERPLPSWYDFGKIGILIHWGVYSVPGYHSEWFWNEWIENNVDVRRFMALNYPEDFTYADFARQFKAEFFDPYDWARLFYEAGAKYVVMTTKHHDGYALFPSRRPDGWNAMAIGPRRDLVRDVATAVRSKGIKFGVYYSLYEWFNPLYQHDKRNNFNTQNYTDEKVLPDLVQLVRDYSPDVIWSDGDWTSSDWYWKSKDFLSWLYSESSIRYTVVVNDRWGRGSFCKHGDFFNCKDRYNPKTLQHHKWENAFTLDKKSWGYRRNMKLEEVMSAEELLLEVVSTVSCGGNALINVGPTKEGTITPIFRERLTTLGTWLRINGQAIYGSRPWLHQNDSFNPNVWYTSTSRIMVHAMYHQITGATAQDMTDCTVFAIILQWPKDNILQIQDISSVLNDRPVVISILGNEDMKIDYKFKKKVVQFELPCREALKSEHAWVLRFT